MLNRTHLSQISILKQTFIILGCIVLLGAALRVYHLGQKSLWLDEAKLYWISQGTLHDYDNLQGSFQRLIRQNAKFNSAPPLYAILVRYISKLGDREEILRSISCFAGIASIVGMYFLSIKFIDKKSAYFTSFLVAIAPTQVHYSQQLREYSLTFLFAILILTFFYTYLTKPNKRNLILLTYNLSLANNYKYVWNKLI